MPKNIKKARKLVMGYLRRCLDAGIRYDQEEVNLVLLSGWPVFTLWLRRGSLRQALHLSEDWWRRRESNPNA